MEPVWEERVLALGGENPFVNSQSGVKAFHPSLQDIRTAASHLYILGPGSSVAIG